jgi:hypothetical protein
VGRRNVLLLQVQHTAHTVAAEAGDGEIALLAVAVEIRGGDRPRKL